MKNTKVKGCTFIFEKQEDLESFWKEILESKDSEIISNTFVLRKRSWFTRLLFWLLKI